MTRSRAGPAALLLLLYSFLALLFTYPLVLQFLTHHVGEDGGDARVYLWNLWWVDKALVELHRNPYETDLIFYPLGIGLSLHTLGFLYGLFYIPLKIFFGPVAAPNLIVIWTFIASALGMYGLARYLGASRSGAFLAGLAFGFCPYRLARLAGHYDLLGTEWLPLYALVFLRALHSEKVNGKLLLGAGAMAAACGYAALNYLFFLVLFTLLYLAWILWKPKGGRDTLLFRAGSIGVISAVLLSPLLLQLYRDLSSWTYPPYPGSDRYGADLAAYFLPAPTESLLGRAIGRGFDPNLTETTVFPGYLVLLLAAGTVWSPRLRRSHPFWLASAGVFFLLSLGDRLRLGGWETGIPLPFALFGEIPLVEHLRAPSRFSILVMLCLAVLLAGAWTGWQARFRQSVSRLPWTWAAASVLVAESLAIPIPLFKAGAPDLYGKIAEEPGDFTVVEIPGVEQVPGRLMYRQTVHGKRILIGTAARVPREKIDYYFGLHLIRPLVDLRKGKIKLTPELIAQEEGPAPRVARFLDLRYIVIDRSYEKRGVVEFLQKVLPVETALENSHRVGLRVRDGLLPPLPWSIDPGARESRMYFESGWSRPERAEGRSFRWGNARRSTLLVRRPSTEVREVVLMLSPLEDTRQEVTGFLDGALLGEAALRTGWNELRWSLPKDPARAVERIELRWSHLSRASKRDPRRLAARIGELRFE
ncbi:MAG: hypothetical protein ACE5JI_04055 [Acidobacteriota bacterium]